MLATRPKHRRMLVIAGDGQCRAGLMAGFTTGGTDTNTQPENATVEGNEAEGETVVIGFSVMTSQPASIARTM